MIKRFWLDGHLYLKIVNCILKENDLPVSNNKWVHSQKTHDLLISQLQNHKVFQFNINYLQVTRPTFLYALYGFNAIKILVCLISGYTFVVPIGKWSPSYWLRMLIVHGRFVFGFESVDSLKNVPDNFDEVTVTDCILAGLTLLAYFSRYVNMASF